MCLPRRELQHSNFFLFRTQVSASYIAQCAILTTTYISLSRRPYSRLRLMAGSFTVEREHHAATRTALPCDRTRSHSATRHRTRRATRNGISILWLEAHDAVSGHTARHSKKMNAWTHLFMGVYRDGVKSRVTTRAETARIFAQWGQGGDISPFGDPGVA